MLGLKSVFGSMSAATIFVSSSLAAQQQQITIHDTVLQISPEASCPDGMERRVSPANQQVALSSYGQDVHYCVGTEEGKDAATPLQTSKVWPTFVPRSELGYNNIDPSFENFSIENLEDVAVAISEFVFPEYLFSGCHDRAHAAYLMLPADLQSKAIKVWVGAPAVYSPAFQNPITIAERPEIEWNYHVALAFPSEDGLVIYDPALSPKELVSESDWLNTFEYPDLSFRTYTAGSQYLWYTVEYSWNGNSFRYDEGQAGSTPQDQRWIPNALARDAVGQLVESGSSCPEFQQFRGEPGKLLSELQKAPDQQIPGCLAERSMFDAQVSDWEQRINP